jgi:AraC-like DNA-binding protein
MAIHGDSMYNPGMRHGAPSLDLLEQSLEALRARLILSRRDALTENWDRQKYCSPFWRLCANNRKGAGIWTSAGPMAILPGRLVLIPPWLAFETRIPKSGPPIWQCYLHFECPGLPASLQRMLFPKPLCLDPSAALSGLVARWEEGLLSSCSALAEWSWAQSLAQAGFSWMLETLGERDRAECALWLQRSGKLGPLLDHIDRHLSQPLRNPELASLCHCSEDHLIRLFRRGLGVTPAQYVIDRRLTAAAEWLAQTDRTLEDIAAAAGFVDRFHFSKCFKGRIGLPPVVYRKVHRAG